MCAVQSQKAGGAYILSKQLLPIGFEEQDLSDSIQSIPPSYFLQSEQLTVINIPVHP